VRDKEDYRERKSPRDKVVASSMSEESDMSEDSIPENERKRGTRGSSLIGRSRRERSRIIEIRVSV